VTQQPTIAVVPSDAVIELQISGGPVGPPGPPNAGVYLKGVIAAWPPAASPDVGDLYVMPDPPIAGARAWALAGHGAFWDGTAWVDAGHLKGPQGDQGIPGPPLNIKGTALSWVPDSNAKPGDLWILPDPLPMGTPAGFKAGGAAAWDDVAKKWIALEAIRGPAGHSITVYGPSPVPPPTAEKGDIWLASDPSLFSATFDPSGITPIPGPAGPAGVAGPSAFEAWKLASARPTASLQDFIDAIRGAAGSVGPKGDPGETLKVNGVVATAGDLPTTPPLLTVNVTSDDGHLWVYDPSSAAANANGWNDLGKISGPAGASAFISASVASVTALPAKGAAGQMIFVTDVGHLYGWNDTTAAWVDGGKISDGSLDDGTAQGQMLVWDDTAKRWSAADVLRLVAGTATDTVLTWDNTQGEWHAGPSSLSAIGDVDATAPAPDDVLAWDGTAGKWVPKTVGGSLETLTDTANIAFATGVDVLRYDELNAKWVPGQIELGELADVADGTPGSNDTLVFDSAVNQWQPGRLNLENLGDCDQLATAADGEVPAWDAATSRWIPKSTSSPILFIGSGAIVPADASVAANNYGMPADTVPPPASYPPAPGDQYLDLVTGLVSAFTGTIVGSPRSGTITGVSSPASRDLVPEKLNDLSDVTIVGLVDKQVLQYDGVAGGWKNADPAYTKAEIDTKVSALVIGFSHGVAVQSIVQDPPASPVTDEVYIVGTTPTGIFATHANELAVWDGTKWVFSAAQPSEAHLVEDQSATFGWSGTAWVKVATAISGGSSARAGVGEIIPWISDTFPATDYLECKGQVVAIATYADLYGVIGNKYNASTAADGTSTFALPDLRGYFLRGDNTGLTAGTAHPWTTGLPKTPFVTTNEGSHSHSFKRSDHSFSGDGKYRDSQLSTIDASGGGSAVGGGIMSGGAHSHAITGGDAETAPAHFVVKWLIRYKPINGGATGATGPKGDATPLGEIWQVGSIQQSMLTEPQWATLLGPVEGAKWVLADGRNCTGTKFGQITGKTNLPDLRGAFLRSAGQNRNGETRWNGGDVGQWYEDSTALPKRAFTTSDPGNHDHGMGGIALIGADVRGHDLNPNPGGNQEGTKVFQAAGAHTHTIGGGDAQTAPVHVAVNTFIKIN